MINQQNRDGSKEKERKKRDGKLIILLLNLKLRSNMRHVLWLPQTAPGKTAQIKEPPI